MPLLKKKRVSRLWGSFVPVTDCSCAIRQITSPLWASGSLEDKLLFAQIPAGQRQLCVFNIGLPCEVLVEGRNTDVPPSKKKKPKMFETHAGEWAFQLCRSRRWLWFFWQVTVAARGQRSSGPAEPIGREGLIISGHVT